MALPEVEIVAAEMVVKRAAGIRTEPHRASANFLPQPRT
jgi:hypothetical protein